MLSMSRLAPLALVISAALSTTAYATNGLAPTGLGMEHRAMGGAAVAHPANTTTMATNPAAASFIPDGYDVGLEVFKPDRSATFKPTNTNYSGNGKSTFYVPEGGYKRSVGKMVAAGVAVYGNGGMNTSYSQLPAPFSSANVGVDYQQLFVAPTVSFKVNSRNAIGVSANLVYQKFKTEGLTGFANPVMSVSPTNVTNNGYDSSTGVGATLGWLGQVSPRVNMGLSYRSKVKMGKLDKYSGLLANGGEFNVPAAITAGVAFKATPKTTVAFDIQRIEYAKLGSIGNSSELLRPGVVKMGSDNGPGFGWNNQTVYKLGVKHQFTPKTALMAGLNYGKSPVKATQTTVNVLAPATSEKHLALGAEFAVSPKSKLIVSYIHAFNKEIQGQTNTPNGVPLGLYDLKMSQNALGIAFSHRF